MREDFMEIKVNVNIFEAAVMLCGRPERGNVFKYPNEKTASIYVYENTQSFFDFGRGIGGDVIALWAHIRGCSQWEALKEIKAAFNLSDTSSRDRPDLRQRIEEQKRMRAVEQEIERHKKRLQTTRIDFLQWRLETIERLLESDKLPPFCDFRMILYDEQAKAKGQLDELCGVA